MYGKVCGRFGVKCKRMAVTEMLDMDIEAGGYRAGLILTDLLTMVAPVLGVLKTKTAPWGAVFWCVCLNRISGCKRTW